MGQCRWRYHYSLEFPWQGRHEEGQAGENEKNTRSRTEDRPDRIRHGRSVVFREKIPWNPSFSFFI
jgi:hypothetical protein